MNHLYSPSVMSTRFNFDLMKRDAASKGWSGITLAAHANVGQTVVSRFFRGGTIRPETAQKLALALGKPLKRYLVDDAELVAR